MTTTTIDNRRLDNLDNEPQFDKYGEWIGGREPTPSEQRAAEERADEVLVVFWQAADGGARREDEWAEWDALSDDDRLHFGTF